MTEQPGERPVTAEVGEKLISLMAPDVDPELVRLALGRAARSAAGSRDDDEGRDGDGKPRAGLLREHAELLALIRDSGIGRARLRAILGLNPESQPDDDGNPRPPAQ